MSAQTSISAAIDALLSLAAGLPEFARVQVCEGMPVTDHSDDLFMVGDVNAMTTATGTQRNASLGRSRRRENYTLDCVISSMTGGTNQRAARVRAFELFDAFSSAVTQDPTLGGAVMTAEVSTVGLEQTKPEGSPAGRVSTISFTISVENDILPR